MPGPSHVVPSVFLIQGYRRIFASTNFRINLSCWRQVSRFVSGSDSWLGCVAITSHLNRNVVSHTFCKKTQKLCLPPFRLVQGYCLFWVFSSVRLVLTCSVNLSFLYNPYPASQPRQIVPPMVVPFPFFTGSVLSSRYRRSGLL